MSLLISLLLVGLDGLLGAPPGREVYRMPQSTLKALSDRGTVVLEAAMASALSTLERASSERGRAEAGCRGCVPCLFQNCGQLSGSCSSPSSAFSEPSCDVIGKAQKLEGEAERSWALSQACAFYRHRCPPAQPDTEEACVRIMGESCSARVLQCSLLNTMQNLEPTMQTHAQAVCGQRSSTVPNITQPHSRIVGGSPAPPGSWPWLVNLQLDGSLMCGGVLVDSSWVVTAAHCFTRSHRESDWTAIVGDFDITRTDPGEQVVKVNRIIAHPKFNPKTFNNDIAVVELTAPVVLSQHVTPVCLPSAVEPPTGSPCLVAGWGSLYEDGPSAETVMEAKVPLLPQSTCKSALGKELVTNTMLCAGYLSGGIDSCQGDSGGPLIYQDRISGRFQLHGITSWGDGCGEKGKPGVYTRVSAFSDWIQAEIQKSLGSREPTCPELLKTTEMSEEEQKSEFGTLCRFYTLTCPPGLSASACRRAAEEKCLTRFKKCQLRSFLQTLLDLLQRAEDYIRDKVDMTFFTQTLPQLVEHIYSTAFAHTRERRDLDLSPKERRDLDLSPKEWRDLDLSPRERRDLDLSPRERRDLDLSPRERQDLDLIPRERRNLDLDLSPRERRDLDLSPKEWRDLDLSPGEKRDLDLSPRERQDLDLIPRERRNLDLDLSPGLTQIKEPLGGAVEPQEEEERGPSPAPPALFRDVGPLVDDWEKYLRSIADDLDKRDVDTERNEERLFLQSQDASVQQLEAEFRSSISALRSRLDSRVAPPTLHLDTSFLQEDTVHAPPSPSSSPDPSSSSSQESHQPWSLLAALIGEIEKLGTEEETKAEEEAQSDTSSSLDATWSDATSEDFTFVEDRDRRELKSARTETSDPKGAARPSSLRRKHRSLLHKRQIPAGKVCPGVKESSQRVSQVRDSYSWVLNIPSRNLRMSFQEVLVDLSSKNERGLYQARIRAVVGGRPLTFYSLVGLENESFYRSVPRIIAVALEALKT